MPEGIDAARQVIDDARDATHEPPAIEPPERIPPGAGGIERPKYNGYGLPEGCPIIPVGVHGNQHYLFDNNGQLREFSARDFGRLNIYSLLGCREDRAERLWPKARAKRDETGQVIEWIFSGWDPDLAARDLMRACARQGIVIIGDKVRGRGAWIGDDDELIWHLGDTIWRSTPDGGVDVPPGPVGRHIYPAGAPLRRPIFIAHEDVQAGAELLADLKRWHWQRPQLDPYLLLGWLATAPIGGALDWRAPIWLTGDAGTGKSSLQKFITRVISEGALVHSDDATPASIYQALGPQTLPVTIDEAEATAEDSKKMLAMLAYVRNSASGAIVTRGSKNGEGPQGFQARSSFMLSSIVVPPMVPADYSRFVLLDLKPLEARKSPAELPVMTVTRLNRLGARLAGRVVANWQQMHGWMAVVGSALARAGATNRSTAVYEGLLAAAAIVTGHEAPDSDTLAEWIDELAPLLAETAEQSASWPECVSHLMTYRVRAQWSGGQQRMVAAWVHEAHKGDSQQQAQANEVLSQYGMRVVPETAKLLVANSHGGLLEIYQGTNWQGKAGAVNQPWKQMLRRVPGAVADQQRIGRLTMRCTAIDLALVFADKITPPARLAAATATRAGQRAGDSNPNAAQDWP